jgi:hypothetical protein
MSAWRAGLRTGSQARSRWLHKRARLQRNYILAS